MWGTRAVVGFFVMFTLAAAGLWLVVWAVARWVRREVARAVDDALARRG